MGKKITVIVPVYNTKKFLTRCVNSILKQSYENLEVIIIDDGSTDGSAQVCDELSKSDKRVRVIHQKNKGIATTRNIGIENATGYYISFVDSDDYLEKDLYKNLYKSMLIFIQTMFLGGLIWHLRNVPIMNKRILIIHCVSENC